MRVLKIIFFIITITTALTLILTTKTTNDDPRPSKPASFEIKPATAQRVSRFLQQKVRNPNAADHCNKDNEICQYILEGRNTTCCNNKCVDLGYDDKNCGACKKKCEASDSCCRGECVNLSYDKRHCSFCNNRCMNNGLCIYGICDYA